MPISHTIRATLKCRKPAKIIIYIYIDFTVPGAKPVARINQIVNNDLEGGTQIRGCLGVGDVESQKFRIRNPGFLQKSWL